MESRALGRNSDMATVQDRDLSEVGFLSDLVRSKLQSLEIHTLRQLAARIQSGPDPLERYLELSDEEFRRIRSRVAEEVRKDFREQARPRDFPPVNKRGVAVDRFREPRRPRYRGD